MTQEVTTQAGGACYCINIAAEGQFAAAFSQQCWRMGQAFWEGCGVPKMVPQKKTHVTIFPAKQRSSEHGSHSADPGRGRSHDGGTWDKGGSVRAPSMEALPLSIPAFITAAV